MFRKIVVVAVLSLVGVGCVKSPKIQDSVNVALEEVQQERDREIGLLKEQIRLTEDQIQDLKKQLRHCQKNKFKSWSVKPGREK